MRIGELAQHVSVNPKTIRYYEDIGLLPVPSRTASGYREYDADDQQRLAFIRAAQRLGFSLDEIREVLALREQGERPCDYVLGVVDRQLNDIDGRIAELHELRSELVRLKEASKQSPPATGVFCSVIEHVHV
ncbi:MAG TPA: heavy metal-responsive transcriptional regulator [Acidimicrobiales bacterium]|nr:heavy metal-responsive transcriptional regulator [Acidimicrobiales bacterium]